jgi:hypothetical protein
MILGLADELIAVELDASLPFARTLFLYSGGLCMMCCWQAQTLIPGSKDRVNAPEVTSEGHPRRISDVALMVAQGSYVQCAIHLLPYSPGLRRHIYRSSVTWRQRGAFDGIVRRLEHAHGWSHDRDASYVVRRSKRARSEGDFRMHGSVLLLTPSTTGKPSVGRTRF